MRLQKTVSLLKAHIFIKLRNKTKKEHTEACTLFRSENVFLEFFGTKRGKKATE